MKRTIEIYTCDLCGKEGDTYRVEYPVVFHTDATEGRPCKPHIERRSVDMCIECKAKVLMIQAENSMGQTIYRFRDLGNAEEREVSEKAAEEHRIAMLQYENLRRLFSALTDAILGKDYYNLACDIYTSDRLCCEDIAYRFGKKAVTKFLKGF